MCVRERDGGLVDWKFSACECVRLSASLTGFHLFLLTCLYLCVSTHVVEERKIECFDVFDWCLKTSSLAVR